jgi:hypothetical protein
VRIELCELFIIKYSQVKQRLLTNSRRWYIKCYFSFFILLTFTPNYGNVIGKSELLDEIKFAESFLGASLNVVYKSC